MKEILALLQNLMETTKNPYQSSFSRLYQILNEKGESGSFDLEEITKIKAYFSSLLADPSLLLEEPREEVYEGQEVIWPPTLFLCLEEIETCYFDKNCR
ncbi:MAG: hypothetical protein PWP24_1439 [Clostridiales bacterium]|nr:hypothetical protein [Clostridiales bacterium]